MIEKWLSNKNTIEFLGIWESMYNPNFNSPEFEGIKNAAGLNRFILSVKQWVEKTNSRGIIAKAGRYGGTYAHKDIAFEFATWVSPQFKLYLIQEFERMKTDEQKQLGWTAKRELSKINYRIHTDAINKFNHNSDVIKSQYKNISDLLCELLGRANLFPYEKPKFKDESGHILLNSLYLYPWYCFKCFYSSKHVRGFFKTVAWSIWLIYLGLLFFIARDNAILQQQQDINRYVHAYYSDNAEVKMELEGIDLMFSNQEPMPMPIKEYREYMKELKKEAKAKGSKQK